MALHYPVMIRQISKHLQAVRNSPHIPFSMIDCTIGTGGHSIRYLEEYPNLYILGFDIDKRMIDHLKTNVLPTLNKSVSDRLQLINRSYTNILQYSPTQFQPFRSKQNFDFILADFGYNMLHISNQDWGFSYLKDGELDMRYHPQFKKCSDLIAQVSRIELTQILIKYGEIDKTAATQIAKSIILQRSNKPIKSTQDLVKAINSIYLINKHKLVVKVFMALRIFINSQLDDVYQLCKIAPQKLGKDGKGLFVTFHSMEHTSALQGLLSCKEEWRKTHKLKVQDVTQEEVTENNPSRSAKLIVFDPSAKVKSEKKYKNIQK